MKTVLCGTDFSLNANHAFQYCLSLAEKTEAKVVLLHAWQSPVVFSEMPMTAIYNAEVQIWEAAEKKLTVMKKKAAEKFPAVHVETTMEQGLASDCIVKYADQHDVDLVITGTTGTGKVERFFAGSTASSVIQHANCPVLCIPKGMKFRELKKIVFATDLREDNLMAAIELTDFAKLFDAEIIFVFVDDQHLIHSDEGILAMTRKIRERVKYPKISGYICRNTQVTNGLEYFLKNNPADLLAMFTHKKKFPGRVFHPSITKVMANKTTLPLLALERSEQLVLS